MKLPSCVVAILLWSVSIPVLAQQPDKEKPPKPSQEEPKKQGPPPKPEQPERQQQDKQKEQEQQRQQQEDRQKQEEKRQKQQQEELDKQRQQAEKQREKQEKQQQKQAQKVQTGQGRAQTENNSQQKPGVQPEESRQQNPRQGQHIPDDRFRANFGREHVMHHIQVYQQQRYFYCGGYQFQYVEVWPSEWSYDDDFYVDDIENQYYLFDVFHPGTRILVIIVS